MYRQTFFVLFATLQFSFFGSTSNFSSLIFRVLKPPGGMSSNIFSETESTTSSNESRASSTSPKTPQKVYRMASNFELGDEQPENPTPRRKPFKASGNNKAELLQEGIFFLLQLFARDVIVMKKLKIEKTKPTFIIPTFKTDII